MTKGLIAKQANLLICVTALGVLLTENLRSPFSAEASWLLDPRKFHSSAHGQLSCLDCHGDIVEKDIHPDSRAVAKKPKDFFRVEQCTRCHSDVRERIDRGFHKRVIASREEFLHCIRCHDPHYQRRSAQPNEASYNSAEPLSAQCDACHERQETLPSMSPQDEACMACHRLMEPGDPQETKMVSLFCFHCHGQSAANQELNASVTLPLIDTAEYSASTHAGISCLVCHPGATSFDHASQTSGDCQRCHERHDEKIAHDAHLIVSCESCHLAGITPIREPAAGQIRWRVDRKAGAPNTIHTMLGTRDETLCRRCHVSGNPVGAAAQILPAKSIMCMPCHAATFSWKDSVTVATLFFFILGFFAVASVWLSGTLTKEHGKEGHHKSSSLLGNPAQRLLSFPLRSVMEALIFDVMLQRRLFRQSKTRWAIHGLIFFPFFFRFFWGLVSLVGSLWTPAWPAVWTMLDKNHPVTGFLFDLTGVMMGLGMVLAFFRGRRSRSKRLAGLPRPDIAALGLLAAIVIVGFVVEGMRIAMTGAPGNSEYAFVGFAVSRLFSNQAGLTAIYGSAWYLHAIVAGAFLAYLPFSRLLHIIMAPVVLTLNASSDNNREMKKRH